MMVRLISIAVIESYIYFKTSKGTAFELDIAFQPSAFAPNLMINMIN